jgi:hypothetical protein
MALLAGLRLVSSFSFMCLPGDAPESHDVDSRALPPMCRRSVRWPKRHACPSPEHASAKGDESTLKRP